MKYKAEDYSNVGKRVKFLFFWGHQPAKNGVVSKSCFSQWWIAPFVVNDLKYQSAEHFMMAEKARIFSDFDSWNKIMVSQTPAEAKKLGRGVRGFDQKVWEKKRYEIVKQANYHKFSQHEDLKLFLLETKSRVLVEASPVDAIWGIGLPAEHEHAEQPCRWRGLNLLGFALMEVRDKLQKQGN